MRPDRSRDRLRDMLDAARELLDMTGTATRESLQHNRMLALACARLIEIIGEAAKHVDAESRNRLTDVPWKAIAGTRDRLIHAYFSIDLDRLWVIIKDDLKPLIQGIEAELARRDGGDPS